MPTMKEPKYFCTDLKTTGSVCTHDDYMALFTPASNESLTGEASCWYLYSKIAIESIMAHNPDAKIIVMLRYPVDAAHSLYEAAWGYRHENIADFEEAWRAQPDRMSGKRMPPNWPDAATLQYGAMYRYAPQVRRVLEHVPQDQRHFIIYEEFFADPRHHYVQVLKFLKLDRDVNTRFSVVNPAVGPRSSTLDRLLRKPPRWLAGMYTLVRPLAQAAGLHPAAMLWKLNTVPREKTAMRPAFRAELEQYFAEDIAELEVLLGRRLWQNRSGGPRATGT